MDGRRRRAEAEGRLRPRLVRRAVEQADRRRDQTYHHGGRAAHVSRQHSLSSRLREPVRLVEDTVRVRGAQPLRGLLSGAFTPAIVPFCFRWLSNFPSCPIFKNFAKRSWQTSSLILPKRTGSSNRCQLSR